MDETEFNSLVQEALKQGPKIEETAKVEAKTKTGDSKENEEEDSIVILGKDITKDNLDKIEDINVDYDKACIAGKIEMLDVRELKSGKKLMFTA